MSRYECNFIVCITGFAEITWIVTRVHFCTVLENLKYFLHSLQSGCDCSGASSVSVICLLYVFFIRTYMCKRIFIWFGKLSVGLFISKLFNYLFECTVQIYIHYSFGNNMHYWHDRVCYLLYQDFRCPQLTAWCILWKTAVYCYEVFIEMYIASPK